MNKQLETTPFRFFTWAGITLALVLLWGSIHGVYFLPDSICYPIAVIIASISGSIFILMEIRIAKRSEK